MSPLGAGGSSFSSRYHRVEPALPCNRPSHLFTTGAIMTIHHLKNLLTESLVLRALIVYLAMMVALLVGLASWTLGGQKFVLKASWFGWCATIAMVPFALRIIFGPDTSVICNHCRTWMASWLKHRRGKLPQKEQRQHPHTEGATPVSSLSREISCKACH